MEIMTLALLLTSIVLSVTRSTLAKSVSDYKFGTKSFFLIQAGLFFAGFIFVCFFGGKMDLRISGYTFVLSLVYAAALIAAQWFYTYALGNGNISVCATVYSMGFIFPTVSGMLFWNEEISLIKILGILVVIPAIYLSGTRKKTATRQDSSAQALQPAQQEHCVQEAQRAEQDDGTQASKQAEPEHKAVQADGYAVPLLIAMVASGLLGILQKVQQKSAYAEESSEFILIALIVSAIVSLIVGLMTKADPVPLKKSIMGRALVIGACFGGSNLLNTWLAGMLDSAVFFPVLNIGIILLALAVGIVIFREKPGKKEFSVILLGITAILLLNL